MPKSRAQSPQRYRDNQRRRAARWRRLVVERQGGKCAMCSKETFLTLDHVHALAHGGTNTLDNLRGICNRCRVKHDQRSGNGGMSANLKDWRKWNRPADADSADTGGHAGS